MREPAHEAYRIKVVEAMPRTTRRLRQQVLEKAGYNPFLIPARFVTMDLISDSGTGAMTAEQWAAMIRAREDFAGAAVVDEFAARARSITGFPCVQIVHQGRSAEHLLFRMLLRRGQTVFANTHFETTRANIESLGCQCVDLPASEPPFPGNIDLARLEAMLGRSRRAGLVVLTVTNNTMGGQPVSLENIARASKLARSHKIRLVLDACRFADNAYRIKEYGRAKQSVRAICRRMFGFADIAYLSSKKDGLVNIGGFIGLRDRVLYGQLRTEVIRQEGYPSAGGLAARDVAAMTVGLADGLDDEFLRVHIGHVRYLARILEQHGVRIAKPVGAHAVVLIPPARGAHAAFALSSRIYLETGIRTGVFEDTVRLALPRRVYTRDHLEHAAMAIGRVWQGGGFGRSLRLRRIHKPAEFYNFFVRFKAVGRGARDH